MAKFLVNLGAQVTVEADDEGDAIAKAKTSPDLAYFHVQVQPIIDRDAFVPSGPPSE
jgi:hypothetical protein